MSPFRRYGCASPLLSLTWALTLALVSRPSFAGEREPPSTEDRVDDSSAKTLEEIGAVFRQGQDRFEIADFEGAIASWMAAYEALPSDPRYASTRAMLMVNIAHARVEAHAIDGRIDHLRHADVLFEQYLEALDPSDAETHAVIEEERRKIAEQIEQHEREERARREDERVRREDERAVRAAARPSQAAVLGNAATASDATPYSRWERAMLIGGGVTMAFGLAVTGAMGTFLWLRDDRRDTARAQARLPGTSTAELQRLHVEARRFNRLAISTGSAAAVLTVIGLGIVGAAHARRNGRRAKVRTTAHTLQRGMGWGLEVDF